jgi:hypothetical protein
MSRLKNAMIAFLFLFATVSGFGGMGNASVFATDFSVSRNETGNIDMPANPPIPVTAISTTSTQKKIVVRLNRTDIFCGNQGTTSLVWVAAAMTALEKSIKFDMKNTIIVKLRI